MPSLRRPNIGRLKQRGDLAALVKAFFYGKSGYDEPAKSIREAAAEAIRSFGPAAIPPLLDQMAKQKRKLTLLAGENLLRELAVQARDPTVQQQVIDTLVGALQSNEIAVDVSAALSEMASSVSPSHHRQMVTTFVDLLAHEYDWVRRHAAIGLADIGLSTEDADLQGVILHALSSAARVKQDGQEVIASNLARLRKDMRPSPAQPPSAQAEAASVTQEAPAPPEYLFVIFRDRQAPLDRQGFSRTIVRSLFPEYQGKGRSYIHYECDPNMPASVRGSDPNSYPYAMFRLMAIAEQVGMGKLEFGVRHNLAWSNFDDAYGGRGIVYVVFPWDE